MTHKHSFAATILAALLSCGATPAVHATEQKPSAGLDGMPDNITIIAEFDGCRTYRVEDRTDQPEGQPRIAFMNHRIYYTKCGNMAVPTFSPEVGK